MSRFSHVALCVSVCALLSGCPGTPPATPVVKLITLTGHAWYEQPKPTYYAVEWYDSQAQEWKVATWDSLPWDAEPDANNKVHVTVHFNFTTGISYRVHALNSPPQLDSNLQYIILQQSIEHTETIGVYDGSVTEHDVDLTE